MSSPSADLVGLRAQVTPENVMLLHNGLRAEATFMAKQISAHLRTVGEPGADPVSPQAAKAFNAKIESLRASLNGYVDLLNTMADSMATTAREYGHTEAEINASFGEFYPDFVRDAGATLPTPRDGG